MSSLLVLCTMALLVSCRAAPFTIDDIDGGVTRDEYLQAVDDGLQCMREGGLTASVMPQSDDRPVAINVSSLTLSEAEIDEVYQRCHDDFVSEAELAYKAQFSYSGDELFTAMRDCFVDLGLVEPGASRTDIDEAIGTVLAQPGGPTVEELECVDPRRDKAAIDQLRDP